MHGKRFAAESALHGVQVVLLGVCLTQMLPGSLVGVYDNNVGEVFPAGYALAFPFVLVRYVPL